MRTDNLILETFVLGLVIIAVFGLSGCEKSTPNQPIKAGSLVSYKCINGYVYISLGHGLANYIENGTFKKCD